eukprot:3228303-Amphidinium_carterae.1
MSTVTVVMPSSCRKVCRPSLRVAEPPNKLRTCGLLAAFTAGAPAIARDSARLNSAGYTAARADAQLPSANFLPANGA